MRRVDSSLVFSPTDLCVFVESSFASWMDRYALEHPGEIVPDPPGEDLEMLRRRGTAHENAYYQALVADGSAPFDPGDGDDRFAATREAMRRGEPLIRQAALARDPFRGFADLLVRVEGDSELGEHHYVPLEIKLGLTAKPKYVLQLCAYAELLEALQGRRPGRLELVLGDRSHVVLRTDDHFHGYREQRRAFLAFQRDFDPVERPVPGMGDDHGRWAGVAASWLEQIDHLGRVANIRKSQVERLETAGIRTMAELAACAEPRVPRLDATVFRRLRRQAQLQIESAALGRTAYEVLVPDPDGPPRGLARLPPASPRDVYFDMEGFPLVEGGLEYLFGGSHHADGDPGDGPDGLVFRDGWAHSRAEERVAFERFVDWVHARWRADPTMHVYHYAAYETTALKRLAGVHATREAELDQLLRNEVFCDLYAVVRHGLLVGEPKYSIKNLESLYREDRAGAVTSATDSIVEYQRFLDSGEPRDWRRSAILEGIRDYNRDDCESTAMLASWLRARAREAGVRYRGKSAVEEPEDPEGELSAANRRRRELAAGLLERDDDPIGRLLGQLVEFHRREAKPRWWELFRRCESSDEELVEDLACLGALVEIPGSEERVRGSIAVGYRFDPDQDTKLDDGDRFCLAHDPLVEGKVESIDRERGMVRLLFGPKVVRSAAWPPPSRLSVVPRESYPIEPLQLAIERVARRWVSEARLPPALDGFLRRHPPRIRDHAGGPIVRPDESPADGCVRVVPRMARTTLSIQGPPGTGKTTTAARTVLELLSRGRRVGVTSNSHKAILNLMAGCAELHDGPLACLKVGGDERDPLLGAIRGVRHASGGRDAAALARGFALVGGTAWLFCRPDMRGAVDYLFVDEAGQVSVANLVAMAGASDNLVLVGDPMQLGQPTQGQHPDRSGESTLEYLLQGEPTVPAEAGVFLDTTWRLHPRICRVSSEAFYEGRLRSAPGLENRRILVPDADDSGLDRGAGIVFVPVEHEGNTQGSDEEADVVRRMFGALQGLEHTGVDGAVAGRLGVADVLVVAPYNMQVRKLRDRLPEGARVGTVDKFQGQEAPVVIVSMCASQGHDSPRGIEFLLNPNRLNVALSRAWSLAIVVGHPGLARSRCRTLEQMKQVSLYARVVDEGRPRA